MLIYYTVAFFAAIGAAIAQVFMKSGANLKIRRRSLIKSYFNKKTFMGYLIMFVATIASAYALRGIPLKDRAFFTPITFILVPILSCIILNEELRSKHIIGILIIVSGIVVFSLG